MRITSPIRHISPDESQLMRDTRKGRILRELDAIVSNTPCID
jgi:hypothetical protein